jgi:hypothetical protein
MLALYYDRNGVPQPVDVTGGFRCWGSNEFYKGVVGIKTTI